MGLSGCYGVIKYLVVIVNFIFWIAGLATVALAIWMLVDPTFYVSMAQDSNSYFISTYMLLAAGILLVVVAFLGCCGAFRENQCLLVSFFCLLLVILVAEIAATVWAYIHADTLEPVVRSFVKTTVQEEYAQNPNRRQTFDTIQQGLKCCGAESPTDWIGRQQVVVGVSAKPVFYSIPKSCCFEGIEAEICDKATHVEFGGDINSNVIFTEGCVPKVANYIRNNLCIFIGIGLGIIVIEVVGLIFALILTFAINKNGRYKG